MLLRQPIVSVLNTSFMHATRLKNFEELICAETRGCAFAHHGERSIWPVAFHINFGFTLLGSFISETDCHMILIVKVERCYMSVTARINVS